MVNDKHFKIMFSCKLQIIFYLHKSHLIKIFSRISQKKYKKNSYSKKNKNNTLSTQC